MEETIGYLIRLNCRDGLLSSTFSIMIGVTHVPIFCVHDNSKPLPTVSVFALPGHHSFLSRQNLSLIHITMPS